MDLNDYRKEIDAVDEQLLALFARRMEISAAIAAYSDSNKQLVVRKVRRVSGWNRASRAEQVYRF